MDKKYNERGEELMDPTPIAVPLAWKRPPTLQEQMRAMIQSEEFRRAAAKHDVETFEEAEDFDVGEDYDPTSPWEESFYGQFEEEKRLEATHYEQQGSERKRKTPRRKDPAFEEEKPVTQVVKSKKTEEKTSSISDES